MAKDLTIRNSTAEFLIFTSQAGEEPIEVKYADETVWLTQKMLAKLFDVSIPTINEHLKSIYECKELEKDSTIRNFRIVQKEGNMRSYTYDFNHFHFGNSSKRRQYIRPEER